MRDLLFNVNGQILSKDPECDFSGIVIGSKNYLNCRFTFDNSWKLYRRVVCFTRKDGKKFFYELKDGNAIAVPNEITDDPFFKVAMWGYSGKDKTQFHTTEALVRQERG